MAELSTNAKMKYEDVTAEYLCSATPGVGTVTYENGYRIKGHQDEIEMAEWICRTFGGDVKLLKETEIKNQKRSDYLWRGKLWELKGTSSSIDRADKLLQYAIKQIQDNPGGVILNVLKDTDIAALEQQLTRRIQRSKIDALDLMILSRGEVVRILRYKK